MSKQPTYQQKTQMRYGGHYPVTREEINIEEAAKTIKNIQKASEQASWRFIKLCACVGVVIFIILVLMGVQL